MLLVNSVNSGNPHGKHRATGKSVRTYWSLHRPDMKPLS